MIFAYCEECVSQGLVSDTGLLSSKISSLPFFTDNHRDAVYTSKGLFSDNAHDRNKNGKKKTERLCLTLIILHCAMSGLRPLFYHSRYLAMPFSM